jgi:hypothetical protein
VPWREGDCIDPRVQLRRTLFWVLDHHRDSSVSELFLERRKTNAKTSDLAVGIKPPDTL